ncbi:hypothetical protein [Magnetospirillum sp. UT-4]|uniref:hypothetical protein n=1 Tax=Magnetospirillum sp. UT-4 TaxID=2681467 RepID=UPI00137DB9AE|nr:hypothetical protein [Magnetospirillum sp. UT-4]CAA7622912.1 conserved hypothetical protein [Magnetospirillum sp. UT-4]
MPFVIRDVAGQVVALAEIPLDDQPEELAPDHPEVLAFIGRTADVEITEEGGEPFVASDMAFIRVVEDLIEALMRKNVISLSDLPGPAQDKLMERRALRGWLAGVAGIVDDGEGKII